MNPADHLTIVEVRLDDGASDWIGPMLRYEADLVWVTLLALGHWIGSRRVTSAWFRPWYQA